MGKQLTCVGTTYSRLKRLGLNDRGRVNVDWRLLQRLSVIMLEVWVNWRLLQRLSVMMCEGAGCKSVGGNRW